MSPFWTHGVLHLFANLCANYHDISATFIPLAAICYLDKLSLMCCCVSPADWQQEHHIGEW